MAPRTFIVIVAVISTLLSATFVSTMPPHPDLEERLRAEGRWNEVVEMRRAAKAGGVDQPDPDAFKLERENLLLRLPVTKRVIVILVDFSDKKGTTPISHYQDLLFSTGTYPTGSMRDYFLENSYGNLTMTGEVTKWLRMPQTLKYYANREYGNNYWSYPKNAQKLAEDAVRAADPYVDFSKYDSNKDGYVDALFIVQAGPGAEETGNKNHIWSHKWTVRKLIRVDGVYAATYAMMPYNGKIGVFCHEAGHAVFGLPDLYDTDDTSEGIGYWSLMASGSWGNSGKTPTHMDAWSKIRVGFVRPDVLTCAESGLSIPRVEDNKVVYKLMKKNRPTSEYFLLENRQKVLFDKYMPGSGLLIYHVDDSRSNNDYEWYPGHTTYGNYMVAVEQADNRWELEKSRNRGNSGDPWPGSSNRRTFNASSSPNSKDYDGNITGVAVTGISNSGNTMTADIAVADLISPDIVCPPNATLAADAKCRAVYTGPPATATDNCDPKPAVTSSPKLPATFTGVGTYTITWMARDASGNTRSCNQTVTVVDRMDPAVACPPDSTLLADAHCRARYYGPRATAVDNCDGNPVIKSNPRLPAAFSGVGTYTITWTATDFSGNSDVCVQTIELIDVTKPDLVCPPDTTMEADGNCQVLYTGPPATATDNCDAAPAVVSYPALPAAFTGIRDHTITWVATDKYGNADTCYQTVTVIDVTEPAITCPPDGTLEADENCEVVYAGPPATAIDNCDPNPVITSVPALPATFAGVGDHPIEYAATDSSGNFSTCVQIISVIDVTPPAITCPPDVAMEPKDFDCEITYSGPPATATDNCDSMPVITSIPPLPATFGSIGKHEIEFTATDFSGNASYCTMTVDLLPTSYCLKLEAVDTLEALKPTGMNRLDRHIDKVILHTRKSVDLALWAGVKHVGCKHGHKTFNEEKTAIVGLARELGKKKFPSGLLKDFKTVIGMLLDADEMLAEVKLADAIAYGGVEHQIEKAREELDEAAKKRRQREYTQALDHYRQAWDFACKAMTPPGGSSILSALETSAPATFAMSQNRPNPFSATTVIEYQTPVETHASLKIYDIAGNLICTIVDQMHAPGYFTAEWDGTDAFRRPVPRGIYFTRFVAGDFATSRKMVLVR